MGTRTSVSLFIAFILFGVVVGLESCEVVEVAPFTAPLTCDGEVVTERFVFSVPGETTTSLTHFCERPGGGRTEITTRVTAVIFLYAWALSVLLVVGMGRLSGVGDGAPTEEKARGDAGEAPAEGDEHPPEPASTEGEAEVSDQSLRRLVAEGRKIEAVNRVRDAYGVDLDEARAWVERVAKDS